MTGSPIVSILNVANPGNPFEVLGLPVGPVTESDVIDALGERMRQVAEHPQSETPGGNEVRLALHAAAAQLLDSAIRSALLERAGIVNARPRRPVTRVSTESALGPRALMVIASEGGWNPRAMRRIALLAHAEGIASTAVPHVVRNLAGEHRPTRPADSSAERRGTTPRREARESTSQTTGQLGTTAAAAAAAVLLLALTWLGLDARTGPASVQQPGPQAAVERDDSTSLDAEAIDAVNDQPQDVATDTQPPSGQLDEPDWSSALIGIRDAKQPADAATVGRITDGIADSWPRRTPTELRRVTTAFVDVVYLMSPEEASAMIASMADRIRNRQPRHATFHAGLLSRLSVERSLSTTVDNAVVAAMVSTIGSQRAATDALFERGAALALQYVARGWSSAAPPAEPFRAWITCADAIGRTKPEVASRVMREAIEFLLRSEQDPLADVATLRAVETLAERLEPARDAEASGMVLRLLADQSVTTRAASVLVNAIARGRAGDASIEPIRLSPSASQAERADVRTRLAESWLNQTDPSAGLEELETAIRRHIGADAPDSPQRHLADAVVSARLSSACQFVLWGATDESTRLVASVRGDVDRILAQRSAPRASGTNAGDAWALRYLEARRNIPVRLSLLGEMVQRRSRLGAIAAEVIVAEAISGSPARVRREAQNVVLVNADQPAVINAVLELLPTVPRVSSVQDLLEQVASRSLPAIDDPAWPYAARRAVLDRLLEVEGGTSESQAIDAIADLLADEYARMATSGASTTSPVEESLDRLIDARLDDIRRIDLSGSATEAVGRITRLRAGRLALAEGAVTRFAASHVTATELLGVLVELESPHQRDGVHDVMSDLAEDRAEARSVFEQIARTERASLELWMMRVGVQP